MFLMHRQKDVKIEGELRASRERFFCKVVFILGVQHLEVPRPKIKIVLSPLSSSCSEEELNEFLMDFSLLAINFCQS